MLDAAGKSLVIIETVGVGQDEVDIVRTADISIVILVPGAGDEVQALKAGIMEIADIFVVNKADRDGADRTVTAVESNLALQSYAEGEWRPPIIKTEATTGRGVPELWEAIKAFRAHSEASRVARLKTRSEFRLRELLTHGFLDHLEQQVLAPGELQHDAGAHCRTRNRPVLRCRRHPAKRSALTVKARLDHIGIAVKDLDAGARVLSRRAGPARRGTRGSRVAARARAFHSGWGAGARTARSDRRRFGDREVHRQARTRPAPHHAARRGHPGGARAC